MKRGFTLIFLITISSSLLVAQQSGGSSFAGKYFGQEEPGMTPEIFSPGFISTGGFEFGGTFSPDGKEYFFTRRPEYEGSDNRIYYTHLVNNQWSQPARAPFSEDVFEFIPVISPDGKNLIFYSERIKPQDNNNGGDLWFCDKTEKGWSEPHYLLNPSNKKYCMMVTSTRKGTIYFSGVFNGKRGLFRAELKNGVFKEIEYLPMEINSIKPNHPFIDPDENYMIFDAQVTGMGKPELYISFRKKDGSWTNAANMGPVINSTKTEFAGSVSPDGKYLFFHRRVNGNGDIYWVSAKIINQLRSKN